MEALNTEFRGHYFRSRTEARWAVFFSEVDEEYLYEPQGFDLDGFEYLPDFWLPDLEIWVEIKPNDEYSLRELRKAQLLSEKSRNMVAIVCGGPRVERVEIDKESAELLTKYGTTEGFKENYHIDLCIGPAWDTIDHEQVSTYFEEDHWEWMAEKMRLTFQREDIWFDGTEGSVEKMREMFPHLLEQMGKDATDWRRKWEERKLAKGQYSWIVIDEGLSLIYSAGVGGPFGSPRFTPVNEKTRPHLNALRAAQQARFEHGESGKPSDFEPI